MESKFCFSFFFNERNWNWHETIKSKIVERKSNQNHHGFRLRVSIDAYGCRKLWNESLDSSGLPTYEHLCRRHRWNCNDAQNKLIDGQQQQQQQQIWWKESEALASTRTKAKIEYWCVWDNFVVAFFFISITFILIFFLFICGNQFSQVPENPVSSQNRNYRFTLSSLLYSNNHNLYIKTQQTSILSDQRSSHHSFVPRVPLSLSLFFFAKFQYCQNLKCLPKS